MPAFRFALLADIHGNRPAYQAVMAHLEACRPDALVVAGDIVGGPHDEEILSHLRQTAQQMNVYLVRGNAEDYAACMDDGSAPAEWGTLQQFAMLRWFYGRLSPSFRAQLLALPARLSIELPGADALTVFHGTPTSRTQHLHPQVNPPALEQAFSTTGEKVLVCGHSHQQWLVNSGGRMALNPGAVCAPLDGQTGAQYAMLEWDGKAWQAEFRCIPYCFDECERDMQQSGMLATGYLARAHLASILHGGDWGSRLLQHAKQRCEQAGIHRPYIPDEIWEAAGQEFFQGENDGKSSR